MNIINSVTLKNLRKNRTRTFVTIIGIILSAAMLTAVTTMIHSLRTYMIDLSINENGTWYGMTYQENDEKANEIKSDGRVSGCLELQNIGYSEIENPADETRPFLYVGGADSKVFDTLGLKLTSGHFPKSTNEIILPNDREIEYSVGTVLTLDLGKRISSTGTVLNQYVQYAPVLGVSGYTETFEKEFTKKYTVVGIYEERFFYSGFEAGYTCFTLYDDTVRDVGSDLVVTTDKAKDIYDVCDSSDGCVYNDELLLYMGQSTHNNFYPVLYSMAAILIVIIMAGSVALIYNAFAISVSERTKQFGLMSSIGATKKQLRKSVLFEAFFVSIIGIPIGTLCGMGGIAVTLKILASRIMKLVNANIELRIRVNVLTIAIAVATAIITVLLSAWIPSRRATKITAIDAIRQTNDVKIKGKKLKTSKLTYKLFGFPGMIASKNFKRNRKKYRTTVISLFISVVLFISTSSFCAYLTSGIDTAFATNNFDITYLLDNSTDTTVYRDLSSIGGVTQSSYECDEDALLSIDKSNYSADYMKVLESSDDEESGSMYGDAEKSKVRVVFVSDDAYKAFVKELKLSESTFLNMQKPVGIACGVLRIQDYAADKVFSYDCYTKNSFDGTMMLYNDDEHDYTYKYNISIGAVTDEVPFGLSIYSNTRPMIMYPYSAMKSVCPDYTFQKTSMFFACGDDYKSVFSTMNDMLVKKNLSTDQLYGLRESEENQRSMALVAKVFSYGFIALISLIAAANVFNTISTNINLRRREFATLKSVGMTNGDFKKMMNFECLLYGIKSLIYGLPVSVAITYLIYKSLGTGIVVSFFIPVSSIIISVISVFIVVFASMIFATNKIKKENTIDALKNENV